MNIINVFRQVLTNVHSLLKSAFLRVKLLICSKDNRKLLTINCWPVASCYSRSVVSSVISYIYQRILKERAFGC